MKTFVVVSSKGGAGKTVFSFTIGRALVERFSFADKTPSKVLLIDMDFYVRGLTFLVYDKLTDLRKVKKTSYSVLNSIEPEEETKNELSPEKLEVVKGVSVLPSTNLSGTIDWANLHSWKSKDVRDRIRALVALAEKAGYDFVIIDTRAGPDNTSLGAALASDLTFLLLEPDIVSYRNAQAFHALFELELQTLTTQPDLPDASIAQIFYVHNKLLDPLSEDTEVILKRMTFLPPIPFDMFFMREFFRNARALMFGSVLDTSYGRSVQQTLRNALNEVQIDYSVIEKPPRRAFLNILARKIISYFETLSSELSGKSSTPKNK